MDQILLAERMAGVSQSATMALNARAKQLAAEGKTIYNLTAGELASDTPDYIQKHVASTLHENKYTAVAGLPELREAIAASARDFYGLDWIQAENVVVTAGVKPALYVALMALINPGDEVILPIPTWGSFANSIELCDGRAVKVPLTSEFDLDVAAVMAAITPKTKAILINSPQNPTGAIYSEKALRELAGKLKGSGITILSDDIYSKLVYEEGFVPTPSCGFEQVIILNGFSKSQALTGWRIGYLIAPKNAVDAIIGILSHTMTNAAVPSQQAGLAATVQGDQPPAETLALLKKQRQMVVDKLSGLPGLSFQEPAGAFFFFLDVHKLAKTSAQWCEDLLVQTGVALVPGEAFSGPGYARLSFVTDESTLRAALDLIAKFVKQEAKA